MTSRTRENQINSNISIPNALKSCQKEAFLVQPDTFVAQDINETRPQRLQDGKLIILCEPLNPSVTSYVTAGPFPPLRVGLWQFYPDDANTTQSHVNRQRSLQTIVSDENILIDLDNAHICLNALWTRINTRGNQPAKNKSLLWLEHLFTSSTSFWVVQIKIQTLDNSEVIYIYYRLFTNCF